MVEQSHHSCILTMNKMSQTFSLHRDADRFAAWPVYAFSTYFYYLALSWRHKSPSNCARSAEAHYIHRLRPAVITVRFFLIVYRFRPCGSNTRCMFCTWLVAYCKVRGFDNDFVEIPYKQPYIEMYEDIWNGINEWDFSVDQITVFFEETSCMLFRDCKDCKNSKKTRLLYLKWSW